MRLLLPLFFSILLLVGSTIHVYGQVEVEADSIERTVTIPSDTLTLDEVAVKKEKPKKIKERSDTTNYPFVSALSIYFDYPKLFSFFTEFENKAEIGLEAQVYGHLILRTELGRSRITPTNFYKNANYEVSGNYVRVGLGYTKAMGAKSRLNFGFNYGMSYFEDKGTIEIESPSGLFNGLEEDFERTDLQGDWFEVVFGTESHMGKNIYLGFIARLRVLNSYDSFEELDVFAIPGYGRTFDKSIPALNLYIKYRIPFY